MKTETNNIEIIKSTDKTLEINKLYIYPPYDDREYVKEQKCKYDGELKLWYVISKDDELYKKYKKMKLFVKYDEKEYIKQHHGRWCPDDKCWFTYATNDALRRYKLYKQN